jgi:hypothetical protein
VEPAAKLAILASGIFFLVALLLGTWKYLQMRASPDATAHPYVDTAHRAALLYSFAALLLARFSELAELSATLELLAVAAPLLFFAGAIASYAVHGWLRDTENQFVRPHRLGHGTVPAAALATFMWALIAAEIGGFLVLFAGFVGAQLLGA